MHCPNCGKTFDVGNQCPHCKIDAVLFKGTEKLSNKLYNKGLERIKAMDLSHGLQELSRSVAVNKHNVRARNLLGLVLFEVGHIGEALKHWIISQSQLKENNPAKSYIESINKNTRNFERMSDAVISYNRALEYLKQNDNDFAIIQLKKAVEYNPRFLDALNLLVLCYLNENNRQLAMATLERVFTIDMRNPTALRYHAILNPGSLRPEPRTRTVTVKQSTPLNETATTKSGDTGPFKTVAIREKRTTYFHVTGILAFLIGAACMLAFGLFLFIPSIEQSHELALRRANNDLTAAAAAHQAELESHEEEINQYKERIEELEENAIHLQEQYERSDRSVRILLANNRFETDEIDDLRTAVDMLSVIPLEDLHFDIVAIANNIIASAYPRLATHYAANGIASFNDEDFDRALLQLIDARHFADPDHFQYTHILYHLGTLYYNISSTQNNAHYQDLAIAILMELAEFEGYEGLPSNPWSSRRPRVRSMLENMGIQLE